MRNPIVMDHPAPAPNLSQAEDNRYFTYALAATPAAIGCAMGVLIGGKLRETQRPNVALGLLTVGLVAALPFAIDYVSKRMNHPESPRGSQRRLKTIRDAAIPAEADIYGTVPDESVLTF